MIAEEVARLRAVGEALWAAAIADRERTTNLLDLISFVLVTAEFADPLARSRVYRATLVLAAANVLIVPIALSFPVDTVPGAAFGRWVFLALLELFAIIGAALAAGPWQSDGDPGTLAAERAHHVHRFQKVTFALGAATFFLARVFALTAPHTA